MIFLGVQHQLTRAAGRLRTIYPRLTGAAIGKETVFGFGAEASIGQSPAHRGRISLGRRNQLATGVLLHPYGGSIETGIDVYIGPYTIIYGHGGVSIGKDTLISAHCRILSSNHGIPPLHTIIRSVADEPHPTRIGTDVWLGAGVTILAGVAIGDGCVIGAGAVVNSDLAPGSIAVGVPARVIRRRS
jgi:acetyltransferase-like isoleucine patch superfamily enzyme